LKKNNFEEFNFVAATLKHIPLAGELLSAKKSATRTASDCTFNSEDAGNSALKTTSYSTSSTSQSTENSSLIVKLYCPKIYSAYRFREANDQSEFRQKVQLKC
jgi:hypothetical protein